jgi:hypothetical protein
MALVTVITMVLTPFLTGDRMLWRLRRWQSIHGSATSTANSLYVMRGRQQPLRQRNE